MAEGQEELKNTNITISGVEDTGEQIKIRDQNKRTWSFFKKKKGGDETVAFRNFQHFKVGDTVEVAFREVPYKEGTIKNVVNVKPATGEPEAAPQLSYSFRRKDESKPGREYWEQREEKRQSSILMQVAFKAAVTLEAARMDEGQEENRERMFSETIEFYDFLADQIGESETPENENKPEKLPTIQMQNEANNED